MSEHKIIITAGENPNDWSIDVQNVSVVYLPKLLGAVLKQGIEDVHLNPAAADAIPDIKMGAAMEVLRGIGVNPYTWYSIKDVVPNPNFGPFIGIVDSNPTQIFTGLKYDSAQKVMLSETGGAMPFLTHWYYMPDLNTETEKQEQQLPADVPPIDDEEEA